MIEDIISVIIPVYNAEKYLKQSIESVLSQTYHNLEILLINDGSQDNSREICEFYKKKDSRIKVYHKQNGGASSARNIGLKFCKGKYIVFVDADDYVKKDYLEYLYHNLKKYKVDISICNICLFDENKKYEKGCRLNSRYMNCNDELNYCKNKFLYGPYGKLFVRELIENIYFDTRIFIGEDSLFVAEAIKRSNALYYDSRVLYMYRRNPTSIMHTDDIEKWETFLLAWERIAKLHESGSMAYWSAKLYYLKQCRQIVNKDRDRITMFRTELRKYIKAVWKVDDYFKDKLLLFFLAFFPELYFKFYHAYKG